MRNTETKDMVIHSLEGLYQSELNQRRMTIKEFVYRDVTSCDWGSSLKTFSRLLFSHLVLELRVCKEGLGKKDVAGHCQHELEQQSQDGTHERELVPMSTCWSALSILTASNPDKVGALQKKLHPSPWSWSSWDGIQEKVEQFHTRLLPLPVTGASR